MVRRYGTHTFIYSRRTTLGVTLWRRGAVSLQFLGHFLQVVLGDWWKACP